MTGADAATVAALAAAAGDRDALEALVRATQADVRRLCALLGDPDRVDDLAQETYLRVLGALGGFRAEAPARAWVLAIARRVCADDVRRLVRGRALRARLGPVAEPVPPATGQVELDLLVARLDPDRRSAFVLTQSLGLSYAEAAVVCDCPVGTIRSRVARARSDLLEWLEAPAAPEDRDQRTGTSKRAATASNSPKRPWTSTDHRPASGSTSP